MTLSLPPWPRRPGWFADNGDPHGPGRWRNSIGFRFFLLAARRIHIHLSSGEAIMLSYLLGLIQDFERMHGRVPVLVSLNTRHMKHLLEECPDLVHDDEPFPFGFRISVLPEDELAHPVVSVLPVMRSAEEIPRSGMNDYIVRSPHRESAALYSVRRAHHQ
jgi:hypothetical protein